MHALEFDVVTKYGVKRVSGLLAHKAKNGEIEEVRLFVEDYLDEYYSKNFRDSEFKFPRSFINESIDD